MGGIGSGPHWLGAKDTVESCLSLDIRQLARKGSLKPGQWGDASWSCRGKPTGSVDTLAGEGFLELHYGAKGQGGRGAVQRIALTSTPCTFGGTRPWFRCPECWRRVGILYSGPRFLCRACHGLTYQSQQSSRLSRATSRAHSIRAKLGAKPAGFVAALPPKPTGMHWATYNRLTAELLEAEEAWTWLLVGYLMRTDKQLATRFGLPSP